MPADVHGDDCVIAAEAKEITWFENARAKHVDICVPCKLGAGEKDATEARILNRTVRVTKQGCV